jgi:hypothetical protein
MRDATLEALVVRFREARQVAIRFRKYPSYAVPLDTCQYCGKPWKRWAGSTLDGHTSCMVSDDFKAHLRQVLSGNARLTYRLVGQAFELSSSVVRAWVAPRGQRGRDDRYLRR